MDDVGVGQFSNTSPLKTKPQKRKRGERFPSRHACSSDTDGLLRSIARRQYFQLYLEKTGRIYFLVHLHPQACGQLDASQLAEMASLAKHHAKNVPGYSVHVIDSLAVPVAEETLIAGHR
ncbi:MAG: hypothetical protein ABWY46_12990 [Pseudomonas sp.]|jgi:hypothetical protein